MIAHTCAVLVVAIISASVLARHASKVRKIRRVLHDARRLVDRKESENA